jgi:hypothetical protein
MPAITWRSVQASARTIGIRAGVPVDVDPWG